MRVTSPAQPPSRLGAHVGQQQIAVGERQIVALAVQHLAVRRDDRRVGAAHAARDERRLHRGAHGGRRAPGARGAPCRRGAPPRSPRRRGAARRRRPRRAARRSAIIASASGASSTSSTPGRISRSSSRLCSRQVSTSGAASVATARPRTLAASRASGRTGQPVASAISSNVGGGPSHSAWSGCGSGK